MQHVTRARVLPAASRPRRAAPAPPRAARGNHHLVSPTPPPRPVAARLADAPVAVQVALGGVLAWAAVRAVKAVMGGGSLSSLESRGFVADGADRAAPRLSSDAAYKRAMRGINVVRYEELPSDVVEAARARRARERGSAGAASAGGADDAAALTAFAADVPDDHPFAVKADVSEEEAALAAARLRVRRGLPLRDLSGRRGLPGME